MEEGQHIVLEQGQHVVMVEGDMGQQQLVITDANSGIIQLGNGQQFVMKSEPEDLSLVSGSTGGRGIDMEAGAQAIQATVASITLERLATKIQKFLEGHLIQEP